MPCVQLEKRNIFLEGRRNMTEETLTLKVRREMSQPYYVPCHCNSCCVREINHTGTCLYEEILEDKKLLVSFRCRERDDYPHDKEEPREPWPGPQKPRTNRTTPKRVVGDYIRTRAQLSRRTLTELAKNHPEIPIPENIRRKFLS